MQLKTSLIKKKYTDVNILMMLMKISEIDKIITSLNKKIDHIMHNRFMSKYAFYNFTLIIYSTIPITSHSN